MHDVAPAAPPASVECSAMWHGSIEHLQPEGCATPTDVQLWSCWSRGRHHMQELPKGAIMVNMTRNEASVVDEEAFSVRRSIQIAAPVDKVWRAVAEPEHVSRWFGRLVLDGEGVGATGTMTFPDYDVIPLRVEEFDAPRRITYRWNNDDAAGTLPDEIVEATSTVFTFTLEEAHGGTRLTVVESGFERTSDPRSNLESHRTGWDLELDKMVALVEEEA